MNGIVLPKKIELKLSDKEAKIILDALAKEPYILAYPVISNIVSQIQKEKKYAQSKNNETEGL